MEMVKSTMGAGELEVARQTRVDPLYEVDCSHLKGSGSRGVYGPQPAGSDSSTGKTVKQANCDKLSIIINDKAPNKHIGTLSWIAFAHKHGS
ncbi:putative membrane protein [Emiliania huxleyi virus 145]|nr:putative membrane protein [Emiliania huxleyi virus 145]